MQKLKLKKDLSEYFVGDIFFNDGGGWKLFDFVNKHPYVYKWMSEFIDANKDKPEWFENFSVKLRLPKSWGELSNDNKQSELVEAITISKSFNTTLVKRLVAEVKLYDLMTVYNDGWKPDWSNPNEIKYIIARWESHLEISEAHSYYNFLAFKDNETAETFMEAPEIKKLIKQFCMMERQDKSDSQLVPRGQETYLICFKPLGAEPNDGITHRACDEE